MSSRRSASVVVALAVASLAVTSMGAMVASSELLVDAVDRPARRRLDPLVLDLGSVGTIQAELPPDARAPRPPGRRPPAADPPPPRRREPVAGPPVADWEDDDDAELVVVAHVQVVKRVVVRKPVVRLPPLPPPPPRPDPQPRPRWPRRRWVVQPPPHRRHPPCGDHRWRWGDDDDRPRRPGRAAGHDPGRRGWSR